MEQLGTEKEEKAALFPTLYCWSNPLSFWIGPCRADPAVPTIFAPWKAVSVRHHKINRMREREGEESFRKELENKAIDVHVLVGIENGKSRRKKSLEEEKAHRLNLESN